MDSRTQQIADVREMIRRQRQEERESVKHFASAVRASDLALTAAAIERLEQVGLAWRRAMRSIVGVETTPEFKSGFLEVWMRVGDAMRDSVDDDLLLVSALRSLLPKYKGPPRRLYRGSTFLERKRRLYGLSWSAELSVAQQFAQHCARHAPLGSVVLATEALPEAIVCAAAELSDSYGEMEYIVDRRRLSRVEVVERIPGLG